MQAPEPPRFPPQTYRAPQPRNHKEIEGAEQVDWSDSASESDQHQKNPTRLRLEVGGSDRLAKPDNHNDEINRLKARTTRTRGPKARDQGNTRRNPSNSGYYGNQNGPGGQAVPSGDLLMGSYPFTPTNHQPPLPFQHPTNHDASNNYLPTPWFAPPYSSYQPYHPPASQFDTGPSHVPLYPQHSHPTNGFQSTYSNHPHANSYVTTTHPMDPYRVRTRFVEPQFTPSYVGFVPRQPVPKGASKIVESKVQKLEKELSEMKSMLEKRTMPDQENQKHKHVGYEREESKSTRRREQKKRHETVAPDEIDAGNNQTQYQKSRRRPKFDEKYPEARNQPFEDKLTGAEKHMAQSEHRPRIEEYVRPKPRREEDMQSRNSEPILRHLVQLVGQEIRRQEILDSEVRSTRSAATNPDSHRATRLLRISQPSGDLELNPSANIRIQMEEIALDVLERHELTKRQIEEQAFVSDRSTLLSSRLSQDGRNKKSPRLKGLTSEGHHASEDKGSNLSRRSRPKEGREMDTTTPHRTKASPPSPNPPDQGDHYSVSEPSDSNSQIRNPRSGKHRVTRRHKLKTKMEPSAPAIQNRQAQSDSDNDSDYGYESATIARKV